MRINIYAQEITDRIELVTTTADTGTSFIGIRFYLDSPDSLKPPQHQDDDSSAVTFWVKSGKGGYKSGDEKQLVLNFVKAVRLLVGKATDLPLPI